MAGRPRELQRGFGKTLFAAGVAVAVTISSVGAQQADPNRTSLSNGLGDGANNHASAANGTQPLPSNGTSITTANSINSTSANATNGTNATRSSSSTPLTFPLATLPAAGALLGTGQAPFPAMGGGGGAALGPDDNYIAAAVSLLPSQCLSMPLVITVALIIAAGAVML